MELIKLYANFEEAFFLERVNRFVMQLEKADGQTIYAYIANPGRMEEFLTPGHPFFITAGHIGKYFYHVVSTFYQGSYIMLDTIKINYLVEQMLKAHNIEAFAGVQRIRREVTVFRSKFDFLLEREGKKPALLEIKSCSLCHNGAAMFPDAPTGRGKRHLQDLESLAAQGYDTYSLYLVGHKNARIFMANGHTDRDYCEAFCKAKHIQFMAFCMDMTDPVTFDLSSVKEIPIDFEASGRFLADKGSYILVFFNEKPFKKIIGSLGQREFKKGYYVYVGSALQGLEKRIKRHLRQTKKIRWHLDYISPQCMKVKKIYPILRSDRIEVELARKMMEICDEFVPGFGASDSTMDSHFFYFRESPCCIRAFLDLLFNYRSELLLQVN
ncbi:MAG: DNA/RNA nuclease SfsA [Acidobacteria bacterium]|jgi:sugar fermentation stimulation protein A|nr:DNA/RNA nuclease SfsA [Acidobacteriota bacterium]